MTFALKQTIIFDKIYNQLTPADKRNLKEAMSSDQDVMMNIDRSDKRNTQLICPACCIDNETDAIPWADTTTAFNRRPSQRLMEVKYPNENLVIRSQVLPWSNISPNPNFDGDELVIRLVMASEINGAKFGEIPIIGTSSKIGQIKAGDGKSLYDAIFANKEIEKFPSIEALNQHFIRCHYQNAVQPKPERLFRAINRGQMEMDLQQWPMWDLPLQNDSQFHFPVWLELRDNLFYVKKEVTRNYDLLNHRTDWNSGRVSLVLRHKTFRAYGLLMNELPALTKKSKNLTLDESRNLYHIKCVFFLLKQKIMEQTIFNLNLNSNQIKVFANIILLNNFLEEYFHAEFGMSFRQFIAWDL